jgi:hypothetical protein
MRKQNHWIKLAVFAGVLGGTSVPFVARSLDPLPHEFASGDTISARDMNENFDHLRDGIEALEGNSRATICGTTAETMGRITAPGGLIGYPAMAALCADACGSPTAHACTSDEVILEAQAGVTITSAWYAGEDGYYTCNGWTNAIGGAGTAWHPDAAADMGAYPARFSCNTPHPILCCD